MTIVREPNKAGRRVVSIGTAIGVAALLTLSSSASTAATPKVVRPSARAGATAVAQDQIVHGLSVHFLAGPAPATVVQTTGRRWIDAMLHGEQVLGDQTQVVSDHTVLVVRFEGAHLIDRRRTAPDLTGGHRTPPPLRFTTVVYDQTAGGVLAVSYSPALDPARDDLSVLGATRRTDVRPG